MKAPWPEVTSSEAKGQWDSLGWAREGGDSGETGSGADSRMICVRPDSAKACPARPRDHHGSQPLPCCLSACLPAATQADTSLYLIMAFPGYLWQHGHYLWAGGLLERLRMLSLKLIFLLLGVFLKLKSEGCLHSKCSVCLNHMGMFKWLAGCISWQARVSRMNLLPRGIDFSISIRCFFWLTDMQKRK